MANNMVAAAVRLSVAAWRLVLMLLERLFDVAFRREVDRAEDALCRVGHVMLLTILTILRSRRLVGRSSQGPPSNAARSP